MATVRLTGVDVATGLERALKSGDTVENLGISGLAMIFKGAIDGAGHPWPALASRENGDTWTITAATEITDPEAPGQTVQPGDEIVWDGTNNWWVIVGNADEGNVKAALLQVLTANEDLLVRRADDITRLAAGADGNVLQVAGGLVGWANVNNPLLNIMTADGDLVARAGGAAVRLPKGAINTVLGVDGAGTFGYKADPAGGGAVPKNIHQWWVDYVNGNDGTGDGSLSTPFKTPQAAVVAAHAWEEANAQTLNHIIYIHDDFTTTPADGMVYLGADDATAPTNWNIRGDTYNAISVAFVCEAEPDGRGFFSTPAHLTRIIAAGGSELSLYGVSVDGDGVNTGIDLIDGALAMRRCCMYNGYRECVRAGIWDATAPFTEYDSGVDVYGYNTNFFFDDCRFEIGQAASDAYAAIEVLGPYHNSLWRDVYVYKGTGTGGAITMHPAVVINAEDEFAFPGLEITMDRCEIINDCDGSGEALYLTKAARCYLRDNHFAGNTDNPQVTPAVYIYAIYTSGYHNILKSNWFSERSFLYGDAPVQPGDHRLHIETDALGMFGAGAPIPIYWGENYNGAGDPPRGDMQEVRARFLHGGAVVEYSPTYRGGREYVYHVSRTLHREMYNYVTSAYTRPSWAMNWDQIATFVVRGNGAGWNASTTRNIPAEPLPVTVMYSTDAGLSWKQCRIVPPGTGLAVGEVSLVWSSLQNGGECDFRILTINAEGGTSDPTVFYIQVPGAYLILRTVEDPPVA